MATLTVSEKNPVTAAYAKEYIGKLTAVLNQLDPEKIAAFGALLHKARAENRQVLIFGNGGSAATSSHLAVDFGKGCSRGRTKRFRVISLTDNMPWITAIGNDISYDDIFSEQLANFANKGDVVVAISGSGNSKNVIKALELANSLGCETVGISGFKGGKLRELVKLHIHVQDTHMGRIEDAQMIVGHMLLYGFMDTEGCG